MTKKSDHKRKEKETNRFQPSMQNASTVQSMYNSLSPHTPNLFPPTISLSTHLLLLTLLPSVYNSLSPHTPYLFPPTTSLSTHLLLS